QPQAIRSELTSRYFQVRCVKRVSAHSAGRADTQRARRKLSRTAAGRMPERRRPSETSTFRSVGHVGLSDGWRAGPTAGSCTGYATGKTSEVHLPPNYM